MSLSIKEKTEVRKVSVGWMYSIDENGNPKYVDANREKPNYEVGEIRKQIIKKLEGKGYKVYFCKPKSANCIIRVYKSEEKYGNETYRILGAHCYTQNSNKKWKSIYKFKDEFGLDFSKDMLRIWFYQDEYWDVFVDFFDTYVKVVKEK